ncbi:MAG: mechanosensitive ion channel family protein [Chloroflexi bacterium]|nr:MAG: mechanosensitive ion channel family protein [Chloroflexota bacterium]
MQFSRAWDTFMGMVNGLIAALPNIVLALGIFMLFHLIAKRMKELVVHLSEKRQKARNLGLILGRLTQSAVVVTGLLVSLTVIFPSFKPGDLIQLLGIGSVAIGFAFHDIFQNFLAGILLLLTSPFKIGDEIIVKEFEGTVEDIQTRSTAIHTYDGRRIVIPNADLLTHSVTVNTAFHKRRLEYPIKISFQEDIGQIKDLILSTAKSVEGVLHDPPVQVFVTAFDDSSITLSLYWWTRQHRHHHVLHLQDRILTVLRNRLLEKNVDFPSPLQHVRLYMPTEHNNGRQLDKHTLLADETASEV